MGTDRGFLSFAAPSSIRSSRCRRGPQRRAAEKHAGRDVCQGTHTVYLECRGSEQNEPVSIYRNRCLWGNFKAHGGRTHTPNSERWQPPGSERRRGRPEEDTPTTPAGVAVHSLSLAPRHHRSPCPERAHPGRDGPRAIVLRGVQARCRPLLQSGGSPGCFQAVSPRSDRNAAQGSLCQLSWPVRPTAWEPRHGSPPPWEPSTWTATEAWGCAEGRPRGHHPGQGLRL